MTIGDDHEVARIVGKKIEHYKTVGKALENEIVRVILFSNLLTEYTSPFARPLGDIIAAPGSIEMLHSIYNKALR
jgi:hypothetical protein